MDKIIKWLFRKYMPKQQKIISCEDCGLAILEEMAQKVIHHEYGCMGEENRLLYYCMQHRKQYDRSTTTTYEGSTHTPTKVMYNYYKRCKEIEVTKEGKFIEVSDE